jgi:predicted acylesterase/phospholipase RssA
MTPDGRIVRAMVLSGGAAYAAYEVGVLEALIRGESPATGCKPLNPDVYVGTSGGGVNAAVMSSRPGRDVHAALDFLERLWIDHLAADRSSCREGAVRIRGDISWYADLGCWASNPASPLAMMAGDSVSLARSLLARASEALSPPSRSLGRRALELIDPASLIAIDGFIATIRRMIDLRGIRESDRVLGIATTKWKTGEVRVFGNADMSDRIGHDVLHAAAALPGIKPVPIDGDLYVDGGYVLNTPLQPAIDAGADELHAVFMDPDPGSIPVRRLDNVFDVIDKLYQITRASFFKRDVKLAGDINRGLDVLDKARLNPEQWRGVLMLLGRLRWPPAHRETPFRQLAIHLYHPRDDLGGAIGLMNFDRDHIAGLIARGYADALAHDCAESDCVLPDGGPDREGQSPRTIPASIMNAGVSQGGMVHA